MRGRLFTAFLLCLAAMTAAAAAPAPRVVRIAANGQFRTLDPIHADDVNSRDMLGAVFDTLLEYEYTDRRPYRLKPSMLADMPRCDAGHRVWRFRLRDDLRFADDPAFAGASRRITADDVFFSLKRLADARNHSPVYWMVRGRIAGLDDFHAASREAAPGDDSIYDRPVSGMVKLGDFEFELRLTESDPRFLYLLAMPNAAVVPRAAVRRYGEEFARHPVGSGPFRLKSWRPNYKAVLERNPDFRPETFAGAESPGDRTRPLPLADRLEIWQVRQPMTAWMLFLNGDLDLSALDKDNLELAVSGGELAPALARRGVKLIRHVEFEIRYVGFNFSDPKLGGNLELRRALSLAYDVGRRVEFSDRQLVPAEGPIPPGVAGFDPKFRNPYARDDVEAARRHLAKAGFPGGRDPATGEALVFTFDQTGNSSYYRQFGEITAADYARIGVTMTPVMNNRPRFIDKLRRNRMQLFRYSWVGDYPDAENFLQLFYSKNRGGCNRTGFSDPEFDRLYETILPMADSPERTRLYQRMAALIAERAPWIFEGFPIANQLCHGWLENFIAHNFAFSRWKFLTADPARRQAARAGFTPLSFGDMNAKPAGGGKP
ncbi:MAG: hypothetical protein J6Y54_09205 [Lentisphaeria bacterium]|nr:hypothetical protein [Lentisphaeria bacterium]